MLDLYDLLIHFTLSFFRGMTLDQLLLLIPFDDQGARSMMAFNNRTLVVRRLLLIR
jgi:hypothetical protein